MIEITCGLRKLLDDHMRDLILIPARGGAKRILGKNIKPLYGKPLIYYTLDAACEIASHENICVSTDSEEIIKAVTEYGLSIPFKRPTRLATDTASSYDVVLHAIEFYEQKDVRFDRIILLQPTSPFRTGRHIKEAVALYRPDIDMVVSVKITRANPRFRLFEENSEGYLVLSEKGKITRRQDCLTEYEYNGAIYIMNVDSLINKYPPCFSRVIKYVMSAEDSIDIDTNLDWMIAEEIMCKRNIYQPL